MDSTDPRTQPSAAVVVAGGTPKPNQQQQQPPQQQPHHHHQQHHTQQQQHRQPQQQPNNPTQQSHQQPPPPQLIQPQQLHQQQPQTTHTPQHAQQNQSAGYATQPHAHVYQHHQMQFPTHAYSTSQQHFPRYSTQYGHLQYPQQFQSYTSGAYAQPAWTQHVPFPPVTVSTPPTQGIVTTPKVAPLQPREKKVLVFVDPVTKEPVDLKEDKSIADKSTTGGGAINATKTTNTTTINKTATPAATSASASASASATTTTTTTTTTTSTKPSSAPTAVATTTTSSTPANKATITQQSTTAPTTTTKITATTAPQVRANATSDVTKSSANDRTATSSPPSVSNILLQKVSEDTNSAKRHGVTPKPMAASPVVASKETNSPPPPVANETIKSMTKEEKPSTSKPVEPETKTTPPIVASKIGTPTKEVDKKAVVVDDNNQKDEVVSSGKPQALVSNVEDDKKEEVIDVKDGCDDDSTSKSSEANGEIALHYEPGQYNPTSNRSGKKKYSRQFMIDVCKNVCKLDLSSEGTADGGSQPYVIDSVDIMMPKFNQNRYQPNNRLNDQARRPNPKNYTGRSSAGQEPPRKVIAPSSSLTNEVELKTVSNPWRPGKEVKEEAAPDTAEVEDLRKKFRSILNKLTPNNFDNLKLAVTDLHIDTETKLGEVIDIVFAKALAEPGYCVLYGQMCSHLKKISAGSANFGSTLLGRCQHQFNSDVYSGLNVDERRQKIEEEENPEKKKHLQEELYEGMYRSRMRSLGLIKFIGELYKIEMLNDQIMFDCIQRLLYDPTSEESLECLCDLLTTIGEKLDRSSQTDAKDKQKGPKNALRGNAYQGGKSAASVVASGGTQQRAPEPVATLDSIFEQLHKIRKNKDLPISLRIRFKLLDVCDLREKENWISKKTKDNNPKKIDEIKKEHMYELESERQKHAMGPRRSQEGRRFGHASGSSSQISSLGNDSGANRLNIHTSASSQSIRDHSAGEKALQNNSDQHKHSEMHRSLTKKVLLQIQTDVRQPTNTTDLRPGFNLRPIVLRPGGASTNATATSNAANTTSSN